MNILIVDDDEGICKTLELYLSEKHTVKIANDVQEFHSVWECFNADLLLLDLKLPDGSGLDILQYIHKQQKSSTEVIMITGHSDMETPIEAMRMGASDYIRKPLDIEEIEIALTRIQGHIVQQKSFIEVPSSVFKKKIVGHSKAILDVLKKIGILSTEKVNVFITGESGTGKELIAKTIHLYANPEQPFIAVNCSAFAPGLIESELFGHEKGAFTHATEKRVGRFELVKNGTLFLDEIGELSPELQVKLLRVTQERVFERVGGNKSIAFEGRIISATNKNIQDIIAKKLFREDLYFRLCTDNIFLPPLRERKEDIPELIEYIVQKINHELHKKITKIPENIFKVLKSYSWPGNIRELENVLVRASLLSYGDVLKLPPDFLEVYQNNSETCELLSLAEIEKRHIKKILKYTNGNITQSSNILEISRPTLRKKISDYGITNL